MLKPFLGGPEAALILTKVEASAGKVTLTWTDLSTNEDAFVVARVTPSGTYVSTVADLATDWKTAPIVRRPRWTPRPHAQGCYQVTSYDYVGSFVSNSNVACLG